MLGHNFVILGYCNQPIDLYSENMVNTFLELFGPNDQNTLIASNDQLFRRLSFIEVSLESSQSYYLRITVSENAIENQTGEYTIRVIGPGGNEIPSENRIVPLSVNGPVVKSNLTRLDQEDWYVFQPAVTGVYTIVVNAPDGQMSPLLWKQFPINYTIDQGPLGPLESEKAIEFTKNNIEIWNGIDTTEFSLAFGGQLDVDVQMSLFETFPALNSLHPFFYNPGRESIQLFERNDPSSLWEWNSLAWQHSALKNFPSAEKDFSYTYDENLNQLILFGGVSDDQILNETWFWKNGEWTRLSPENSPSPRSKHTLSYDANNQNVIFFGGQSESVEFLDETWIWNGSSWSEMSPSTSPSARIYPTLFYDPNRGSVILFGGLTPNGPLNDMWEWDGENWSLLFNETSLTPQFNSLTAFRKETSEVVLVGGNVASASKSYLADTWIWDGESWVQMDQGSENMKQHTELALAYHEKHDQLVLLAGDQTSNATNTLYVWNNSEWETWGYGADAYYSFRDELQERGINPLIFDNDGRLTDLIQGQGAGDVVRGFGKPVYLDLQTGEMLGGHMFINGKLVERDLKEKGYTGQDDDFKLNNLAQLMIHEFGHFAGLFHSQLHSYAHGNSYLADERFLPIMWGIRPRPESSVELTGLKYDDIATLSTLYSKNDSDFITNTGVIQGKAVFRDGSPVLGGIVNARRVGDRYETAVTVATDALLGFSGDYTLPRVPEGEYEVWIEPMIFSVDGTWFHQTGFHAISPVDRAFKRPPFPQYYQQKTNDLFGPSIVELVQVEAGETIEINFECDLLKPDDNEIEARLRNSQFMAFGSLMVSGHGDLNEDNRLAPIPFTFIVQDGINDVMITIEPSQKQPLGVRIDREGGLFYSSEDSPEVLQSNSDGSFSIEFNRSGENGFPLSNGIYFIEVMRQSDIAAPYTIHLNSQSVDEKTKITPWKSY